MKAISEKRRAYEIGNLLFIIGIDTSTGELFVPDDIDHQMVYYMYVLAINSSIIMVFSKTNLR